LIVGFVRTKLEGLINKNLNKHKEVSDSVFGMFIIWFTIDICLFSFCNNCSKT